MVLYITTREIIKWNRDFAKREMEYYKKIHEKLSEALKDGS